MLSFGEIFEPTVEFYLKAPWKPNCAHHEIGDRVSSIARGTEFLILEGPITLKEKTYYRVKCGYSEGFVLREHVHLYGTRVDDQRDAEVFTKTSGTRLLKSGTVIAAGTSVQRMSLEEEHEDDEGALSRFVLVQYRVMGKDVTALVKAWALVERERVFGHTSDF